MNHEHWMTEAVKEARLAVAAGELPIGGVLVGGNKLLGVTQTRVRRMGSIVAHGELTMLMEAKSLIYTAERPLVLYSTLEPCLMCLGACMQCEIDMVVFGMKCAPDGGVVLAEAIQKSGQKTPIIVGPIFEDMCLSVWSEWKHGENHPAYGYASQILEKYGRHPVAASSQ